MTTRVSTVLLGAGGGVQSVNTQTGALATGTTTIPADDTIPQITEGDEYMTRTITFRVRAGSNGAGTTTFNGSAGGRYYGGVMSSSITVTEIAA